MKSEEGWPGEIDSPCRPFTSHVHRSPFLAVHRPRSAHPRPRRRRRCTSSSRSASGSGSPGKQGTAADYFLGARDLPAWAILLSIVATETSALTVISVPGIGARGDLTFLQLTFGYSDRPDRRGRLAPARIFPRRAGDGLRPARAPLRRRHPAAHLRHLPGHPLPGRRGAGLRQRHPARAGHRLEHSRLDRGDGRGDDDLHLVRRLQGGGLGRRAAAVGLPRRRDRRAVRRLAPGRRAGRVARPRRPRRASFG